MKSNDHLRKAKRQLPQLIGVTCLQLCWLGPLLFATGLLLEGSGQGVFPAALVLGSISALLISIVHSLLLMIPVLYLFEPYWSTDTILKLSLRALFPYLSTLLVPWAWLVGKADMPLPSATLGGAIIGLHALCVYGWVIVKLKARMAVV